MVGVIDGFRWCILGGESTLYLPAFLLSQDGTRYFDIHHTPDDTLDKVDRAQLDQNVAAWAALVWLAADSDVDFRTPGSAAPRPQS